MNNNNRPSRKECFSDWAPTDLDIQFMLMLAAYLSGIALGISIAVIITKFRG